MTKKELLSLKNNEWLALGHYSVELQNWAIEHFKFLEVKIRTCEFKPATSPISAVNIYRLTPEFDIDEYLKTGRLPNNKWATLPVEIDEFEVDYVVKGIDPGGIFHPNCECRLAEIPTPIFGGVQFEGQDNSDDWFLDISMYVDDCGVFNRFGGKDDELATPIKVRILKKNNQ